MHDTPTLISDLTRFLDYAVSPAHAVCEITRRLEQSGFSRYEEHAAWTIEPGHRFYVTRATGSIIAVDVGQVPPSEVGYVIIGAHTDSPNLRLRPKFDAQSQDHVLLSVEPYGSPLLHTWLDRDLGVAGTVHVSGVGAVLVRSSHAVARVSSLAVHLNRDVNRQGLKLDQQTQLRPTIALEAVAGARSVLWDNILAELAASLARTVQPEEVTVLDLGLFDIAGANCVGARGELLTSARLDNLVSCHAAVSALETAQPAPQATRVVVLYDHEEVGSRSNTGAQSPFLSDVLARVACMGSPAGTEAAYRASARSRLLSADMAHGVHPNYADKHDEQHRPRLGCGPALKTNANQAYASDPDARAAVIQAARRANVELQQFASRNDIPCGSTIGPIAAARTGLRVADIGSPMLSMHSCREVMAISDIAPYIAVMRAWFELT